MDHRSKVSQDGGRENFHGFIRSVGVGVIAGLSHIGAAGIGDAHT